MANDIFQQYDISAGKSEKPAFIYLCLKSRSLQMTTQFD